MDKVLINKKYEKFDYTCRYTGVPYYYNIIDDRTEYGLGSNILKNISWVAHQVKPTDTLDSLALHYYNNPSFWWVIADWNRISDPFIKLNDYYTILQIPPIKGIEFGDLR